MEKDIGKIPKNPETDILVRVDDFGGKRGVTIREFVTSPNYKGFTKAGTRISAEHFEQFKDLINAIDVEELKQPAEQTNDQQTLAAKRPEPKEADSEDAGLDSEGLM